MHRSTLSLSLYIYTIYIYIHTHLIPRSSLINSTYACYTNMLTMSQLACQGLQCGVLGCTEAFAVQPLALHGAHTHMYGQHLLWLGVGPRAELGSSRVLVSGIFPWPARPRLLARRRRGSSVGSLRWLVVGAAEWKSTRGDNAARERMPIGEEREREREREREFRAQSSEPRAQDAL